MAVATVRLDHVPALERAVGWIDARAADAAGRPLGRVRAVLCDAHGRPWWLVLRRRGGRELLAPVAGATCEAGAVRLGCRAERLDAAPEADADAMTLEMHRRLAAHFGLLPARPRRRAHCHGLTA